MVKQLSRVAADIPIWRVRSDPYGWGFERPDPEFNVHKARSDTGRYCIEHGVCGFGAHVPGLPASSDLEEVLAAMETTESYWVRKDATRNYVRRWASEAQEGDLVLSLHFSFGAALGQIAGPWRYDGSDLARDRALNHVRDVRWLDQPLGDLDLSESVSTAVYGSSRTFQQVRAKAAKSQLVQIWNDVADGRPRCEVGVPADDAEAIQRLNLEDLEALVLIWAQREGIAIFMPRFPRPWTEDQEWEPTSMAGEPVEIQVRVDEGQVDDESLSGLARGLGFAIAFSPTGNYVRGDLTGAIYLEAEQIGEVARLWAEELPDRISQLFRDDE